MSCFFSCFRVKDSGANLVTPSEAGAPSSKNALSSLFQSDSNSSACVKDASLRKGEEFQNRLPGKIDVSELEDENKFSKSDETSLKTPIKIRKTLEKWEDASAQIEEQKPLKLDSWLPSPSMENLKLEKQSDESSLDTPSSCMTDGHYTAGVSSSSIQRSDIHNAVETHASDMSAISSISSEQSGAGIRSVTKPLPYPNTEEVNEGGEDSAFGHQGESTEQKDEDDSKPSDLQVIAETDDEGSLTSWFKPISAKQDGSNKQFSSTSSQNKKPPADRPIVGGVAAYWSDIEAPNDPPSKWWDGNGIPNSTNKYKEDQKVSWHATPFEERLEKALSEESLISQRKPTNSTTPFEFNETEESDTAISHFQSSPRLKTVVSC